MARILDYELLLKIGQGSFSEVYRARRLQDGADSGQDGANQTQDGVRSPAPGSPAPGSPTPEQPHVAIKVIKPPIGLSSSKLLEMLRYEFWVLKDLNHPNIVRVKDFGQLADGRVFMVQEYVVGVHLKDYCQGRSFSELEPLFIDLLRALAAVHRWHVIHGDVKGANIMVERDTGRPRLLDFGLATGRVAQLVDEPLSVAAPEIGYVRGTPATMAPEMILKQPIDHRSDLYSLGVCCYEALTGLNPFITTSIAKTLNAHIKVIPRDIRLKRSDVPPRWAELIHKLLAKNPDDRPRDAEQALELIRSEKFVFIPTELMGRERELRCVSALKDALEQGTKTALVVDGPMGVGVRHFVREVFYQLVGSHPAHRESLQILGESAPPNCPVVLCPRLRVPKGYNEINIYLKPFNVEHLKEWLSCLLRVEFAPSCFVEQVHQLTGGLAQSVIDLLGYLNGRGLLADASGRVTKSTLTLVPWGDLFDRDGGDFDWMINRIGEGLVGRRLKPQDPLWGSCYQMVESAPHDEERFRRRACYGRYRGACLIEAGDYEAAREELRLALDYFEHRPASTVDALICRNFLAFTQLRLGRVQEAIEQYEAVNCDWQKLPPGQKGEVRNLDLGSAYLQAGRIQDALIRLKTELELIRQEGCTESRGQAHHELTCLYNLAQAHQQIQQYTEAEPVYEQVLQKARVLADAPMLLRAHNGLGNLKRQSDAWREAIQHYAEAIEVALAIQDLSSAAAILQNRGALSGKHGLYHDALNDLKAALRYLEEIKTKYPYEKTLLVRTYTEMGEIHAARGQREEARAALERAWHLAELDDDVVSFRFWVLSARLRVWRQFQERGCFDEDFRKIQYYADDEHKRQIVQQLKSEAGPVGDDRPREDTAAPYRALLKITSELAGDLTADELMRRILEHAIVLSKAEVGVVLLLSGHGELVPRLSLNVELSEELSKVSMNVAKRVLEGGKSIMSQDAQGDQSFNQYASVISLQLKSILGVPICFKGEILGVLYLSHRYQTAVFSDSITIVEAFATQVALALVNHRLLEAERSQQIQLRSELQTTKINLSRTQDLLNNLPEDLLRRVQQQRMVTRSVRMLELLKQLDRVAQTQIPVVIHGETGTGKELFARLIHTSSPRHGASFITVNCGAIPAHLMESELFGHCKGAFSGADNDKMGLLEAADHGTLFLDEIAELSPDAQVKLLRALQEQEIRRVGETKMRSINLRVIVASHQSLKKQVASGKFREDLYYRLMGYEARLPALRERREDIPLLMDFFLKKFQQEQDRKLPQTIGRDLIKKMTSYAWPGNIRELKNFIDVGASLASGRALRLSDLPDYMQDRLLGGDQPGMPAGEWNALGWYHPGRSWQEHELLVYASALRALDFDIGRVAQSLGVSSAKLYQWMRKHRFRERLPEWEERLQPYEEGLKLEVIRRQVFKQAGQRHQGHPYHAAKELNVAPVTFYRWVQ